MSKSEPRKFQAAAVREMLDEAERVVAELEAEEPALTLAELDGEPGAGAQLTNLAQRIGAAKVSRDRLQGAYQLALKREREAEVLARAKIRGSQMAAFQSHMLTRRKAMEKVLKAAAEMALAYGEYSEATVRALNVVPVGAVIPVMKLGPEGVYGPAFGPAGNLILAECYRLGPERKDGIGRFIVPFSKSMSAMTQLDPGAIPAGIDEFTDADNAIIDAIEQQISNLNARDMGAAPAEREAA